MEEDGDLFHRIPWHPVSQTYREVCLTYAEYVAWKYGQANTVFDGYATPSMKDATHQWRAKGKVGTEITLNR